MHRTHTSKVTCAGLHTRACLTAVPHLFRPPRYRLHCTLFWSIWLLCIVPIVVPGVAFVCGSLFAAIPVGLVMLYSPADDLYHGHGITHWMPWLGKQEKQWGEQWWEEQRRPRSERRTQQAD
jgi:hypothetical protein